MNPETILLMTQLIRFGSDSIEALQSGEKTDEEVMKGYEEMTERVKQASERWRGS